jgi:hypothetical protein
MKEVLVKDLKMVCHMNCGKVHLLKREGTFVCEGLFLHHKKFICESETKCIDFMAGIYGKTKFCFYLNEKNSPIFDTIEKLVSHYHENQEA